MEGKEMLVHTTIQDPDEIRQSKSDPSVYVFYRTVRFKRWVCPVVKDRNETSGFLITAYITDAIKEGDRIWTK